MPDFHQENVLRFAVESFAETIALKLKQLRRYVPKEKALTNTDLTGAYIEELVRGFIRTWIGHQQLLHGTLYFQNHVESGGKPFQIDGIVYDPTKGPVTLQEGNFAILHPAFCSGVIEIKMTVSSTSDFEQRLQTIHSKYLDHMTTTHVMGVVIADRDPVRASKYFFPNGREIELYDYNTVPLCPIFVLFKETTDCEYEPFITAIDCMIRGIFNNLFTTTNYLG
jgi:hypothetical protein